MVERAGRCGKRRPEAGQGRVQEPRGPPQGQREPSQTCEQGRKPLRTALRTPLGTAAQGAWRAATCGWGWAAHLPGPAPHTMWSSCPRASRGSPHPGAAWAARPPCGGGGPQRGGGLTPAPRAPGIRLPTQALGTVTCRGCTGRVALKSTAPGLCRGNRAGTGSPTQAGAGTGGLGSLTSGRCRRPDTRASHCELQPRTESGR